MSTFEDITWFALHSKLPDSDMIPLNEMIENSELDIKNYIDEKDIALKQYIKTYNGVYKPSNNRNELLASGYKGFVSAPNEDNELLGGTDIFSFQALHEGVLRIEINGKCYYEYNKTKRVRFKIIRNSPCFQYPYVAFHGSFDNSGDQTLMPELMVHKGDILRFNAYGYVDTSESDSYSDRFQLYSAYACYDLE